MTLYAGIGGGAGLYKINTGNWSDIRLLSQNLYIPPENYPEGASSARDGNAGTYWPSCSTNPGETSGWVEFTQTAPVLCAGLAEITVPSEQGQGGFVGQCQYKDGAGNWQDFESLALGGGSQTLHLFDVPLLAYGFRFRGNSDESNQYVISIHFYEIKIIRSLPLSIISGAASFPLLMLQFGANGFVENLPAASTRYNTDYGLFVALTTTVTKIFAGIVGRNGIHEFAADTKAFSAVRTSLCQIYAVTVRADVTPNVLYVVERGRNGILKVPLTGDDAWTVTDWFLQELGAVTGLAYDPDRAHLYATAVGANGFYDIDVADNTYTRRCTDLGRLTCLDYVSE
jgi:hypothetical protein